MTTIWTVGHGARTLRGLLDLLTHAGIRRIVDIRRFPGSRRHPHFGGEALRDALSGLDIAYEHDADLGGFRRPAPDSPNRSLRNESFRGFADHMATPSFREALERLISTSGGTPTAIMCAETLWWRCHRRLVADALLARGLEVEHLLDAGPQTHELTPEARVEGDLPVYDRPAGQQPLPEG